MQRFGIAAFTVVCLIAVDVANAGRAAQLDPTFGAGGLAIVPGETCDAGLADDDTDGVLVDKDGRVVVVGSGGCGLPDVVVARFTPSGAPDPAFGDGGVTRLDLGATEDVSDAALTPEGAVLVLADRASGFGGIPSGAILLRFGSNGRLDRTFGGDGQVPLLGDQVWELESLPTGGVLVFGASADEDVLLMRFGPDGRRDPSFGSRGRIEVPVPRHGTGLDVVVDSRGRLVITGARDVEGRETHFLPIVTRLLPDGSFDRSFGASGRRWQTLPIPDGYTDQVALDRWGHIVVFGVVFDGDRHVVARLRRTGSLDWSFGGGGVVYTQARGENAIDRRGRLLFVYTITDAVTFDPRFAVTRLTRRGDPDRTFGTAGTIVPDLPPAIGRSIAVAGGSICIAGSVAVRDEPTRRIGVARLLAR